MKNFKLKICSLILCICMCLTILSGCSLFVKKDTANAQEVILTVGDKELTREEVLDAYNSFYQQNYYYFMYYDEDTILETFYNSLISRYLILSEAEKLIKDGKIVFSDEDMDKVWNNVFDYFTSQIDSIEKSILLQENKNKEDELPDRLKDEEETDDEKAYKYEPYEREEVKPYEKGTKTYEVNDEYIANKVKELKETGIYMYNDSKSDDEEDRNMVAIPDIEKPKRLEAFLDYLQDLMFSAKANNKDYSQDAVLTAEVKRIYKVYYENALTDEYEEYVNSTVVNTIDTNYQTKTTNENLLSDKAIYDKYNELFNISQAQNTIEDNYIEVVTSTSNSSLILYRNEQGKYVYFTVQHILVSFDDETLEILKNIEGYDASKDALFRERYKLIRDYYYQKSKEQGSEILTTVERDENGKPRTENGEQVKVSISKIINNFNEEYQKRLDALQNPTDEEKIRVRTLLFQEYAWRYSSDTGSLNNGLGNILGFGVSSEPDENGDLVVDFTEGARKLYNEYERGEKKIGEQIDEVVSDYGVHIMMLTGVYTPGDAIDLSSVTATDEDEKVSGVVEILKNTYISNLTTETYYDYIYDQLKSELVGDSGKYFTRFRNELIQARTDEGKIVYKKKLTYKQLNDSIS